MVYGFFSSQLLGAGRKGLLKKKKGFYYLARCHEIDIMNKVDSTIFVDSTTGTIPGKTSTKLIDYFNESALISYDKQSLPVNLLIIFKPNIYAEIQSVSLISSTTNVKRFQVDLIDDYKSVVQSVHSNDNLTAEGLTAVGIAAIQITYTKTNDNQPPKNIRLSIKGCFAVLPTNRRTATTTMESTTAKAPETTPLTMSSTMQLPQTTKRNS